jgi:O-antigen ligase
VGSFAVGVAGLSVALGALPLPAAAAVAVGIPTVVLSAAIPRLALLLLLFSIPFSSFTKVTVGAFDVTSTDVLVGFIMATWVARSIAERRLVLRAGPTIGMAVLLLGAELLAATTATSFPTSLKEMIKLAELIAMALYAATHLRSAADARFVAWGLIAAGVAEAGVGLFQFATGRGPESFQIGPFIRAYGDFAQPNAFAGYMALVLPFSLAWSLFPGRGRPFAMGATLFLTAALLASLSRGAWLGTALGVAAMSLAWTRHAKRVLAAGVGLIIFLIPAAKVGIVPASVADRLTVILDNYWVFDVQTVQPDSGTWAIVERMAHWQAGWAMAMAHPLVGVGPGNYETVYPDYFLTTWVEPLGHAHNLYLNMFAELGVVGLLAFLAFTIAIFVRIIQGWRLTTHVGERRIGRHDAAIRRATLLAALGAAVTFSVHNTFDNMFIHGMGVQFGLILGLVEAQLAALQKDPVVEQAHASRTL